VRVHAVVGDLDTARRAVAAGATVVQLRVKAPTAEIVARGQGFGELGVTFVVNDDIAAGAGADGALGQRDRGADRACCRPASRLLRVHARPGARRGPTTSARVVWGRRRSATPTRRSASAPSAIVRAIPVIAIGGIEGSPVHPSRRGGVAIAPRPDPS
jgi:thiamine monophosphate synthase